MIAPTKSIYLDYAANTPIHPNVVEIMVERMLNYPGSSYAPHHIFGQSTIKEIAKAKQQIGTRIGVNGDCIHFTSSATEANNIALIGLENHLKKIGRTHIITTEIEHRSVLGPLEFLEFRGFKLTVIKPKPDGYITANDVANALLPNTGLISIQAVNNELGTIQPLSKIAAVCRNNGTLFHTDAAQALSRIDFSVQNIKVDLATISAHKCYGPNGIAALYIRKDITQYLTPLLKGGGSTEGIRPGSLSVALCAGFATACDLAKFSTSENMRLEKLRNKFLTDIKSKIPTLKIHEPADPKKRVPGIISLRIPNISAAQLVAKMPQFSFGISTSNKGYISHIIKSITRSDSATNETIRISFGNYTTAKELDKMAKTMIEISKNG